MTRPMLHTLTLVSLILLAAPPGASGSTRQGLRSSSGEPSAPR
jgi:hypothetical protein